MPITNGAHSPVKIVYLWGNEHFFMGTPEKNVLNSKFDGYIGLTKYFKQKQKCMVWRSSIVRIIPPL